MGAERDKLVTISVITDTDVAYYEVGEIDGSFQKEELKKVIRRHGHKNLCAHLAFLQYQVWDALREINGEENNENVAKNNSCTNENGLEP